MFRYKFSYMFKKPKICLWIIFSFFLYTFKLTKFAWYREAQGWGAEHSLMRDTGGAKTLQGVLKISAHYARDRNLCPLCRLYTEFTPQKCWQLVSEFTAIFDEYDGTENLFAFNTKWRSFRKLLRKTFNLHKKWENGTQSLDWPSKNLSWIKVAVKFLKWQWNFPFLTILTVFEKIK